MEIVEVVVAVAVLDHLILFVVSADYVANERSRKKTKMLLIKTAY